MLHGRVICERSLTSEVSTSFVRFRKRKSCNANILIEISAALPSTSPMPHPHNAARQASKTAEMINLVNNVVYSDNGHSFDASAGYDRSYPSKHQTKRRSELMTSSRDINPWFANVFNILESPEEETEAEYYKRLADVVRYHVIENPEVLEEYENNLKKKKKKKDIRRPSYDTSVSFDYDYDSSVEENESAYGKRRYVVELQLANSEAEKMEINNNANELFEDQLDNKTLDGVQEESTFRPSFPDDDDDQLIPEDLDLNVEDNENNESIKDDKKQYYNPPKIEERLTESFKSQRPWEKDEPEITEEKAHTNDFRANYPKKDAYRYNDREDYQKKRNSWENKSSQWDKNRDTYTKKEKRNEGNDYTKEKILITSDHKGVKRLIDDDRKKDLNKQDSEYLKDKDNINDGEKKSKQLDPDKGREEQRKEKTFHAFKDWHKNKIWAVKSYGLEKESVPIRNKNRYNILKEKTTDRQNEWNLRDKKKKNHDHGKSDEWDKEIVDDEYESKQILEKDDERTEKNKDRKYDQWDKNDDSNQKDNNWNKKGNDWNKNDDRNNKGNDWNKKDNRNKKDSDWNANDNEWNKKRKDKNQRNHFEDRNKNNDWNKKNDDWDRKENEWYKKDSDKINKDNWNKKDQNSDTKDDNYKKKLPEPSNNDWDKVGIDTTKKQEWGQYDSNQQKIEDIGKGRKISDDYRNHRGDKRKIRRKKKSATNAVKNGPKMAEHY